MLMWIEENLAEFIYVILLWSMNYHSIFQAHMIIVYLAHFFCLAWSVVSFFLHVQEDTIFLHFPSFLTAAFCSLQKKNQNKT